MTGTLNNNGIKMKKAVEIEGNTASAHIASTRTPITHRRSVLTIPQTGKDRTNTRKQMRAERVLIFK